MKLAITIMVVLGLVAAVSAAVFVQSLSFFGPKEAAAFDVLVATQDLGARTALAEGLVEVKKLPAAGLPKDYLSNWSQAAGKILKVAVVKGQPLTDSQFIPKNSIDDLLRPGMLAFSAPISTRQTAVNLLYPGCIVDVFATFPLTNKAKGEAVVTPLLQNIQVLAIAEDTVIPAASEKEKMGAAATRKSSSSSGNVNVTLELTARQAAAVQLAMEKGTLGLAMRNPTDKSLNPMEPMIISQGRLTAASEAMDPQTLALVSSIQQILNPQAAPDPNAPKPAEVQAAAPTAPDPNLLPIPGLLPKRSTWQVTVIRAQKAEEVELDVEAEPTQEQNDSAQTGG